MGLQKVLTTTVIGTLVTLSWLESMTSNVTTVPAGTSTSLFERRKRFKIPFRRAAT